MQPKVGARGPRVAKGRFVADCRNCCPDIKLRCNTKRLDDNPPSLTTYTASRALTSAT